MHAKVTLALKAQCRRRFSPMKYALQRHLLFGHEDHSSTPYNQLLWGITESGINITTVRLIDR
jgi:hypothetical protein